MIKIKKLPHPIVSPLWHPGIPPSQVYSRILMITQREKLSKKPFFYRMAGPRKATGYYYQVRKGLKSGNISKIEIKMNINGLYDL